MRRGIELAEAAESVSPTWLLLPLAEEYLRFGHTRECSELIEKMFDRVRTGQRWEEAEIFRVKGEMLLMQGDATGGEQCLRNALVVARSSRNFAL